MKVAGLTGIHDIGMRVMNEVVELAPIAKC